VSSTAAHRQACHHPQRHAVGRQLALIDEAIAASGGVHFKTIGHGLILCLRNA
jgi:hypothetical protein